ncbi:MAG: type IV toxin-antitoxin system AbiEi family antitoxin domain-containing protein [Actinomycetota bacterium]
MTPEEQLWALSSSQAGLLTVRQTLAVGLTRHQIAGLVKRGTLRRLGYGILAVCGSPRTRKQDLFLGVLLASNRSGGDEITGAICGPTAGYLWGLLERGGQEIHVVSTRRVRDREDYRFHFTTRLPERDVVTLDGVQVTDPIRTFLDLCHARPHAAIYIFKRGLRKKLFTVEEVGARIEEESRQGREGLCVARMVIASTSSTAARAKSAKEDHYFELLVDLGYPPPLRNFKVRGSYGYDWEIDLYYAERHKGFEVSPYDTHMDPLVDTRDSRKGLDLRAMGIEIISIADGITDAEFRRQVRAILGPPGDFPRAEEPPYAAKSDEESESS